MTENIGYKITRSVVFENNRGFALGINPNDPAQFVTWQFTEENGHRDYYWGHYKTSLETATRDYELRISEYNRMNRVAEKGAYRYYSTQRPVDINTFPKTDGGPILDDNNFFSTVKIQKVDSTTGKVIPAAGVSFKVWDVANNKWVTQSFNYPTPTTIDVYQTAADGTLVI